MTAEERLSDFVEWVCWIIVHFKKVLFIVIYCYKCYSCTFKNRIFGNLVIKKIKKNMTLKHHIPIHYWKRKLCAHFVVMSWIYWAEWSKARPHGFHCLSLPRFKFCLADHSMRKFVGSLAKDQWFSVYVLWSSQN